VSVRRLACAGALALVAALLSQPTPAYAVMPEVVITSPTWNAVTSSIVEATYTVTDAVEQHCYLDGAEFECGSSSVLLPPLPDGTYTFTVTAVGSSAEESQAGVTWTVDAKGPDIQAHQYPPGTSGPDVTFEFTISDLHGVDHVDCEIDGGPFSCTELVQLTALSEQSHTFRLTARDVVGNQTFLEHSWTVDYDYPSVLLQSQPARLTKQTSYEFEFSASTPHEATVTCRLDGIALGACPSTVTVPESGALTDGPHEFEVEIVDGSSRTARALAHWVVDTTAPTLEISHGPGQVTNGTAATFVFESADANGIASLDCAVDGDSPQPCSTNPTFSGLTEGNHSLDVIALDKAGNQTVVHYAWFVDTTKPTVTITAPTSPVTLTSAAKVAWTGSDAHGIQLYDVRYRRAGLSGGFGDQVDLHSDLQPGSVSSGPLQPGSTYCFFAVAYDEATNERTSGQRCTSAPLDDRGLTTSTGWTRGTGSAFYKGTWTSAKRLGAVLSRTGVTARRLGIVATKCAGCGTVGVYVGSVKVGTIGLSATTTRHKQVLLLPAFASAKSGTVRLKVLSSGKPVRVDGLIVIR